MKVNMEGKFKPLGDRVLITYNDGETKTESGLILTDSAQRGQKMWGEVVSVGPGIFTQNGTRLPMSVKVGDSVMYSKDMAGDVIKLGEEKYLLLQEHHLLGVLKNE